MASRCKSCSDRPLTGFFRTGCCHTGPEDLGLHTVCIEVTAEFLAFSKARGNDLSTPQPDFDFPGPQARRPLVPVRGALARGARGRAARRASFSPRRMRRRSRSSSFKDLKRYAIDLA